ncbi:MAG TPA: hypothetical protein VHC43_17790 [Mycobacteriales bacterium]|nr:hypothetical protein [Mycobacteriales bacterium]
MAGTLIDAWSVVVYTEMPLTAAETDELRHRVERELVAAATWMTATLDPHVLVRVEQ